MKVLITCLAAALALVGCDRRATQPLDESSTSDTLAAPVGVGAGTAAGSPMQPDAMPSAEPCLGLTGQSELDCIARSRDDAAKAGMSTPPAASAEADGAGTVGTRAEPMPEADRDGGGTRKPQP